MRKPCQHGSVLPRGMRCDHGYIQVRLDHMNICRNFGAHTKDSEEAAFIFLGECRRRIALGKAGVVFEAPQISFAKACDISLPFWQNERDADGRLMHSEAAVYERIRVIEKELKPVFGKINFDELTTQQVEDWREILTTERGVSGTTVNRYQGVLSGIYSDLMKYVKAGKIKKAFRLPAENPCLAATWAKIKTRKVIWTDYQLKKLKLSFMQLGDADGWEICKLALKSVLSLSDLKALEIGQMIDTERSKTGVPVRLPITVLTKLNFVNWRKRFEAARDLAGVTVYKEVDGKRVVDQDQTPTLRDMRKSGINALTGKGYDQKLVSQYAGHSSVKTTESVYQLRIDEKLKPLADDLEAWVSGL